jgi:hypothetical protein
VISGALPPDAVQHDSSSAQVVVVAVMAAAAAAAVPSWRKPGSTSVLP